MWKDGRCLGSCQCHWSSKLISPGLSLPPDLFLDDIFKDQILLKFPLLTAGNVLLSMLKFILRLLALIDLGTNFFSLTLNSFFNHNSMPSSSIVLAKTKRCCLLSLVSFLGLELIPHTRLYVCCRREEEQGKLLPERVHGHTENPV